MEFSEDIQRAFGGARLITLDGKTMQALRRKQGPRGIASQVVEKMGAASAKVRDVSGKLAFSKASSKAHLCVAQAQSLGAVITTPSKMASSGHTIYMMVDGAKALGFIKVGTKKLFIRVRAQLLARMTTSVPCLIMKVCL